jgi:nucleoside-diphosphate-sugar epimerase
MTKTVLILGASGKIGLHSVQAFSRAGWTVRTYKRGTDMTAAAMGADVIVNGLNPPNYHDWDTIIPQITQQVIAAAKASGATVIIPGNVYNFGVQAGPWTEKTPQVPVCRKGVIRKVMEETFRRSGVQTIVLRAVTFIDPDGNGDVLKTVHMKSAKQGKITALGRPNAQHAWTYVPDWARAAVALSEKRDALGQYEDIPMPDLAMSIEELADLIAQVSGKPMKVVAFPWWIMRITAPVWELARELVEMRYLWNHDHALGGTRLANVLPDFQSTPLASIARTLADLYVHPDKSMRAAFA